MAVGSHKFRWSFARTTFHLILTVGPILHFDPRVFSKIAILRRHQRQGDDQASGKNPIEVEGDLRVQGLGLLLQFEILENKMATTTMGLGFRAYIGVI